MRLRLKIGLLLGLGVAVLGTASAETPKRGGELRVGHFARIPGFDPFVARTTTTIGASLFTILWGTAFEEVEPGKYSPGYAASLERLDEGTRWRWTLRPGLKYWDGSAVRAQDFVDHWDRLLHTKKRNPFKKQLEAYKEVKALDDSTWEVELKYPWAAYEPYARGRYLIHSDTYMPAWHVEKFGKDLNKNPLGFGPYKMASWRKGDTMTLERNPHYWDPGTQYLDRLVFRKIPGGEQRLAAVEAGDIDVVLETQGKIAERARNKGLQVRTTVDAGTSITLINTRRAPLDDVRVRRAIAHAFDRDLIDEVMGLDRPKSFDVFGPGSKWHCGKGDYPEFDVDKARALLADYGKPVKFSLQVATSSFSVQYGQLFQDMMKKVGIEVEIRRLPSGPQYLQAVFKRNYDLALWRQPGVTDPDGMLYFGHHSESKSNRHGYASPAIDAALEKGRRTSDFEARREAYCTVMDEFAKGVPFLYGYHLTYWTIANKSVRGLVPANRGVLHLSKVWLDR